MVGGAWPAGRLARIAGAVLALAACGGRGQEAPSAPAEGVAVASFNFPESRLVAEIYAQALEDEGVPVAVERAAGSAEGGRDGASRLRGDDKPRICAIGRGGARGRFVVGCGTFDDGSARDGRVHGRQRRCRRRERLRGRYGPAVRWQRAREVVANDPELVPTATANEL
jgi:hypothetical protein